MSNLKDALRRFLELDARRAMLPIRARVSSVDEATRTCTVKPLAPDLSEDESAPEIANVEIPMFLCGSDTLACAFLDLLPGAIVRVGFYEGDINQPYIDAILQASENALAQPAVLGQTLEAWLNSHTHMSPVGPTSPPISPLAGQELAQKVKVV